ncbi:hypothetical protein [[Clostridium] scindens]|uniref:hypothetical protein n=1 Tax=Clostridium scindens (strain JCM 10418 / VPI 12708) TaxID=29347 RepID=UPI00298D231F|nr:hypothetical protein [[Clostridium] scindens]WPB35074.1 hypothetical protein HCEICBPK_03865 [[Clostridium] scindens]
MKKLNKIARNCNIRAYGFQALKDFAENSSKYGRKEIISSLSPAVMAEMGIMEYYAPVFPRGSVYNTAEDLVNADLSVNKIVVQWEDKDENAEEIIVSRHNGTIEILRAMYPNATIYSGNINPEDIEGKFVAGTLPPHLIQYASAYQAVTINNFDYCHDGDLKGKELQERLHISSPISVLVFQEQDKTVKFDTISKITEDGRKEITKIIEKIYDRNKNKIEKYLKYRKILDASYVELDAYTKNPLFVSDVIEKINSVYKLTGREEPFKEIGEILKTETLKARNYVTSHKIEQEILELYEKWKNNGDKSDGIGGINFILEYFQGVIKDEEIELLSRYISEKS